MGVAFLYYSQRTKIFKATLQNRAKISNTKIIIKSTDFDVNIFLLWHLEVDWYFYYRKLRGQRRYSKGTSCNLYFGIFFLIIYLNFGSDVFLFVVFSGTSLFQCSYRTLFFESLYKQGKNILFSKWILICRFSVLPETTINLDLNW